MSKECRNCGSKNTDIEGVFKNCYSCGLRAPVSWEDNDKPASESVAALSKEDGKRIDQYLNETLPGYSMRSEREWVKRGIEYATKYERAKQAELVEENQRLKSQLKDYCNDCQHPTVNKSQVDEIERLKAQFELEPSKSYSIGFQEGVDSQAAELSKLRQENERYKEALQCMMNVEHHGDFMNAFFDLKDQVKAAQQGE